MCVCLCGFYVLFLNNSFTVHFCGYVMGVTQPEINLAINLDQSCGIQSPDGYPSLENRTHAQDA